MAEDFFALLGFPRQPWLESEEIKARFHTLSATRHPDAGGSAEEFSRLNEAARVLAESALRVKHLLELEIGPIARGTVLEAEMQTLFMETGGVLQATKKWREKEAATQSPLAKALLAGERQTLKTGLTATLANVENAEARLRDILRGMNADWRGQAAELASLAERLAFCAKWAKQLREALFQLS